MPDGNEIRYKVSEGGKGEEAVVARLRSIVKEWKSGTPADRAFVRETAGGKELVDVIVKLKDPSKPVKGLNAVTSFRQFVRGTVEIGDIDKIARDENVIRVELGRNLYPDLDFSVTEIQAAPNDLEPVTPIGTKVPDGSGVIVGIIDYGCDFLHRNVRKADGSTRILSLWDQGGGPSSETPHPAGFNYGREISADVLNQALAQATPIPDPQNNPYHPHDPANGAYTYLGYRPGRCMPLTQRCTDAHGTHVMDIATGNGSGSGVPGVAPGADIIFVHIGHGGGDPATESFGNSIHLMDAVDYIFRTAQKLNKSAVINISLGTFGGAHDGTSPVEQFFDTLLEKPNRCIVQSAGNSHFRGIHASGEVSSPRPRELTWHIQNFSRTDNELEIWYGGNEELEMTLEDPLGTTVGTFPLVRSRVPILVGNVEIGEVNHRRHDDNGDNRFDLYFRRNPPLDPAHGPLPTGQWKVLITSKAAQPTHFHSWIERTDHSLQSRFGSNDSDPEYTLGSISCAHNTIAVGAYNGRGVSRPISSFSSDGPTRDGRHKPEVSAPGGELGGNALGVWAARSMTHVERVKMPGTSMASPHVTGLVALIMHAAARDLSVAEIRSLLISTARRHPPLGTDWHDRYGYGRVDAQAIIADLFGISRPHPIASAARHEAVTGSTVSATSDPVERHLLDRLTKLASSTGSRMKFQLEIEPKD